MLKHIILPILIICLLLGGCTQRNGKSETEPSADISASEVSGEENPIEVENTESIGDVDGEDPAEADDRTEPEKSSGAETTVKPPVQDGDGAGFKPGTGEGFPREGMTPPEGFEKGTLPDGENRKNRADGEFPGGANRQPTNSDASEEITDGAEAATD